MASATARNLQLFVGRVAWTVGQKELKEYFTQFGSVKKVRLPWNKDTGFHKNYAIVQYRTEEGMNNALGRDTHLLEGSKMVVQRKEVNANNSDQFRRGMANQNSMQ
ncbi:SRA stem-loop-interacting RNA-binding protein, mitochondrial-like [Branchiostoma floridae]|uniref:SRA stem-loop-interacting RNA-binding protein, mitochondrial-like n=1 Tax=Branchiostoma floridae TaxID=7739 RepID=A0A9J7HSJ6_BRAFL|nr:SRA stem-loop-interacting RNA-binding protein, mitochondrial-like [Branchiostoma floridae]